MNWNDGLKKKPPISLECVLFETFDYGWYFVIGRATGLYDDDGLLEFDCDDHVGGYRWWIGADKALDLLGGPPEES